MEPGSVLIVENMDRLSRQSIRPCTKVIEIINKRVSIGVISENKILDTKSITENPMELMLVRWNLRGQTMNQKPNPSG